MLAIFSVLTLATWAQAEPIQIVALGDSNTAGLFVGKRNAFPALIENSLRQSGYDVKVVNRGISGDTTAGMLSRAKSAVPRGTLLAIVQGGYNDKRRDISPAERDANVEAILKLLRSRGVKVVLCGLDGASWNRIAIANGAVLVPGSACYDINNRGFDRLHMNRAGHRVVAQRLLPVIQNLLQ
ncbi:MAG: hypothetical protein KF810_16005 [Rhizobiaceae bacterium]|nr:hypothetical protein [Rhizobiaceae bacterium]